MAVRASFKVRRLINCTVNEPWRPNTGARCFCATQSDGFSPALAKIASMRRNSSCERAIVSWLCLICSRVDAAVAKNDQRQSAPRAPGDRRARFCVRSIFWESDNRFSGVPSRMIALHFECGAAVEKAARRSLIPHTRVAVRLY